MCTKNALAEPTSAIRQALDDLAGERLEEVPAATVGGSVLTLLTLANQLHAEVARRVADHDAAGAAVADGCRSTKAWLRAFGRLSPHAAAALVRDARLLRDLPMLARSAADGRVSMEHVGRVAKLAERVGLEVVQRVAEPLTAVASAADPVTLQRACDRVRFYADPDGDAPDTAADFARRGITLAPFDGMVVVRGQLDPEGGAALATALDALTAPPKAGDDRGPAQRRADALVDLARGALAGGTLPKVAGVRPQVGILCRPADLMRASPPKGPAGEGGASDADLLPAAHCDPLTAAEVPAAPAPWLDWYGAVPPAVARRVSCDADVWRVVLDPGTGQPLDVGRTHRLVPAWLRKALHARDRGCRFPACDVPSPWTDGHHLKHWADGGETAAHNLVLLCRFHHGLVHEGGWTIRRDPASGTVTAVRPDGTPYAPPAWAASEAAGGQAGAGGAGHPPHPDRSPRTRLPRRERPSGPQRPVTATRRRGRSAGPAPPRAQS